MVRLSKKTKSAIAFALATVLAVPTVSLLSSPKNVLADEEVELPEPIAVYDFSEDETVTFSATAVSNPATIIADEVYGNVVKLDDATPIYVTMEATEATTMWAVKYDENPSIGREDVENSKRDPEHVSGGVVSVFKIVKDDLNSYNVNSSIEMENPFAGRTDLVEEPVGFNEVNYAPIWENGITISYWMKTNGKGTEEEAESPLLSFNREKDGMTHKDDRDKYKLAQIYFADKDNPMFAVSSASLTVAQFKEQYPGVGGIEQWETLSAIVGDLPRTILTEYGVFASMNENYPTGEVYYISEAGGTKTLTKTSCTKQDLSKYYDVYAEGSQARYGVEKGCMTFLASGGFGFTETGLVEKVYKGGAEYKVDKSSEKQFQRNTLHAYTYIARGKDGEIKDYLPVVDENYDALEPLVESTEWHYVTYVIKNDSVACYVDGVIQDDAIYTNSMAELTLEVGDSFNKGWGYHNSVSAIEFPDIIKESGGFGMFTQNEGYLVEGKSGKELEKNILKDEEGNMIIGYNGNCNADTLLEYFTDAQTKLFIGEDGPSSAADLIQTEFGSKADTYIGTMSFFDVPLIEEEVAALYADAVSKLGTPSTPTPSATGGAAEPTPSATGGAAEPTPSATGGAAEPTPSATGGAAEPTPSATGPAATPTPSTPVTGDLLLGDANEDTKVNLQDASLVLRAALNIVTLDGQAAKNADANEDTKINLQDASLVLKAALNIVKLEPKK